MKNFDIKNNGVVDRVVMPLMAVRDTDKGANVVCRSLVNLRPCEGGVFGSQLVAVGEPEVYAGTVGFVPLCRMERNARPVLMCSKGRDVSFSDLRVPSLAPALFASALPGKALCACRRSAAAALVMTSDGPVDVRLSGSAVSVERCDEVYPAVSLLAEDVAGAVSADVQGRSLSRQYYSAESVDAVDARLLANDMLEAYGRICEQAAAAGRMVQPVLARYRLTDRDGHVLFTSAPVLLAHSEGVQCGSGTGVYSDDRRSVRGYTLSAKTWRPSVLLHEASGARAAEVAACEVYMSAMFHPFVHGATASYTTGRGSDASQPFLTVSLPGHEACLSNGSGGATRRVLEAALARLDTLESRVAVINNPFGKKARRVALSVQPTGDAATETVALRAALGRPCRRYTRREVLLSQPHGFTAACTAADAETRAWGDIRVRRFEGYSVANFASAVSDEPWQAVTTVRFGDGSGVVLRESHTTGAPTSLNPVLAYPSGDAVSIIVNVSTGSRTLHGEYALEAEESGRMSVYTAGQVCRLELTASGSEMPAVSAPTDRYPGMVIIADNASPLRAELLADTGEGEVLGLTARRAADQSWEFGRCRFVAATSDGVFSITVGSGRKSHSVRRLSEHGVPGGDAMCAGEGSTVYVLAGGDRLEGPSLYSIDSKGAMRMLAPGRGYSALGYDEARGELTVCRVDGNAEVMRFGRLEGRYLRERPGVTTVAVIDGRAYGCTAEGVTDLCGHARGSDVEVGVEVLLRHEGNRLFEPRELVLGLGASGVNLDVTAEGASTVGTTSWPLAELRVRGACRSALRIALRGRAVRAVRLRLRGTVSPDFVFDTLEIHSIRWK